MKTLRILALSIAAGALAGGVFQVQPLGAATSSADGPGYYCLASSWGCAPSWIHTCWCNPF